MKISMLVHNGVWKDARVLKEARTLTAAGHEVSVYGLAPAEPEPAGTEVFTVTLVDKQPVFISWRLRLMRVVALVRTGIRRGIKAGGFLAIFAALVATFLFSRAYVNPNAKLYVDLIVCSVLAVLGLGLSVLWMRVRLTFLTSAAASARADAVGGGRSRLMSLLFPHWLRRSIRNIGRRVVARLDDRYRAVVIERNFEAIAASLVGGVESGARPDVVHIHDHVALTGAAHIKKKFGCPIVWDAHEIYEDLAASDPMRGALNAKIVRDNEKYVDHFVTINDSIARFYAEKYGLPPATVVMNATEVNPFPVDDGRLHNAAGLARHQKVLLFQGGFGPKRGLKELVEASALLSPDWSLVMMGWGPLEAELKALARSLDNSSRANKAVVFLPGVPQRELQQWSAGATLGAIPYENTGLNHLYCTPNKLWEYPNAGVPILATAMIEMARIIEANHIGFLLPRDFSARDIADRVNTISEAELAAAKQACVPFIERDNWSVYEKRLVDLYAGLAAAHAKPEASAAAH